MKHDMIDGIRYAGWFILVGAGMAGLYGAIGGIILQPMVYIILLMGLVVMMNGLLGLLLAGIFGCMRLLGRNSPKLKRYLGLSLGFVLVFGVIFLIMVPLGGHIF